MSGNVVIFGAKGRFGRAAVHAFREAGWHVRVMARSWPEKPEHDVELVTGNAFKAEDLIKAAENCDVIVNALNPPYEKWAKDLPRLTDNVLQAAKSSGATIMIPGNVYNYGENMPINLTEETTSKTTTTKKGRLRCEMENTFAQAASEGVRTIILRGGDFIERQKTGNWFDSQICTKIDKGIIMYPGPLDRLHAWAYLPDMARAMVALAEKRDQFAPFEQFGFSGFSLTGRELITHVENITAMKLKVKSMPWGLVRALGLFMPSLRELMEMKYLWHVPHGLDGSRLTATLPDFEPTSVEIALAEALQKS